eukprot:CAMPEP_0173419716 /NCGR_PEP_ID=MMETSP1357-20121228/1451_1 /TAXON_ID=77926 /ORGANISM="Hemiselmis rufescens, Strain PCC563" /LENGTH=80 /DNA_ID=CAMNT_0014382393 /DNA_START=464 /DNA_END=703 /DNA_ORIENTATION=-
MSMTLPRLRLDIPGEAWDGIEQAKHVDDAAEVAHLTSTGGLSCGLERHRSGETCRKHCRVDASGIPGEAMSGMGRHRAGE